MKSTITVLAVLMSIGAAVAVRAEVTNTSNQQKVTVVGNSITNYCSFLVIRNVRNFRPNGDRSTD